MIDTNVRVSAIDSPENACRAVLRLAFQGEIVPLLNNPLFAEYEDVFGWGELFERLGSPMNATERSDFLDDVASVCEWLKTYYTWRPNLRDPADNFLLELALAGGAQSVITQNLKDFNNADLKPMGTDIIHPVKFMNEWRVHQWQH
ncbi:MAG: putative toxin-antitoxin system toxin component, PIN family [Alphaproteobacteria bacterium]|nr:putative toxin-antitoxin system toxin component, PIN family [Alphaproteobacteria bacterium]